MNWQRLHAWGERQRAREEKDKLRAKACECAGYVWYCDRNSGRERFTRCNRQERPLCGAKCRNGQACRARVFARPDGTLAARCRLHGGASTGPKNPRTKFTPQMRQAYYTALLDCGQWVKASKQVGLPYKTICRWCERDWEFCQTCALAVRLHHVRKDPLSYGILERIQMNQAAKLRGLI